MGDNKDMNKETIRVSLCSLPAEGWGELLNRKRSEGPIPPPPKIAIVNLIKMMGRCGFGKQSWDFYDIDMLYPSDNEICSYMSSFKPHVIGLSAVVSTSYSQVKRVSSIIRSIIPSAWIVMGGNLSASAEVVLNHTDVDLCVCGDGEIAWVEILEHILKFPDRENIRKREKLFEIDGVAFLDVNGEIKLNGFGKSIPHEEFEFPDYEILKRGLKDRPQDVMNYFRFGERTRIFDFDVRAKQNSWKNKQMASLLTSKGCVGRCTFCQRSTKGFKVFSLVKLEEHIVYLKKTYNVGFVKILDECFGADKKYGHKVAEILWKHGMLWYALMRAADIREEDIDFYNSRGASVIRFGIETGSQKMLDVMGKRTLVKDTMLSVSICMKNGMEPSFSALIGMPGEDEKTIQETGRLLGEIAEKREVHPKALATDIFFAMPHQGTPLWEYGQRIGVIPSTTKELDGFLMRFSYYAFYKRFYINLNGAPIKEVLFWDYLLIFEASRFFWSKVSDGQQKEALLQVYNDIEKKQKVLNPRLSLKYKAVRFTIITYFIDVFIVGNHFIDNLPRRFVYPVVKNLIFIEYLIQRMFRENRKFPLFENEQQINRFVPKAKESLRDVVKKSRKEILKMSQLQKVRYMLNFGAH